MFIYICSLLKVIKQEIYLIPQNILQFIVFVNKDNLTHMVKKNWKFLSKKKQLAIYIGVANYTDKFALTTRKIIIHIRYLFHFPLFDWVNASVYIIMYV